MRSLLIISISLSLSLNTFAAGDQGEPCAFTPQLKKGEAALLGEMETAIASLESKCNIDLTPGRESLAAARTEDYLLRNVRKSAREAAARRAAIIKAAPQAERDKYEEKLAVLAEEAEKRRTAAKEGYDNDILSYEEYSAKVAEIDAWEDAEEESAALALEEKLDSEFNAGDIDPTAEEILAGEIDKRRTPDEEVQAVEERWGAISSGLTSLVHGIGAMINSPPECKGETAEQVTQNLVSTGLRAASTLISLSGPMGMAANALAGIANVLIDSLWKTALESALENMENEKMFQEVSCIMLFAQEVFLDCSHVHEAADGNFSGQEVNDQIVEDPFLTLLPEPESANIPPVLSNNQHILLNEALNENVRGTDLSVMDYVKELADNACLDRRVEGSTFASKCRDLRALTMLESRGFNSSQEAYVELASSLRNLGIKNGADFLKKIEELQREYADSLAPLAARSERHAPDFHKARTKASLFQGYLTGVGRMKAKEAYSLGVFKSAFAPYHGHFKEYVDIALEGAMDDFGDTFDQFADASPSSVQRFVNLCLMMGPTFGLDANKRGGTAVLKLNSENMGDFNQACKPIHDCTLRGRYHGEVPEGKKKKRRRLRRGQDSDEQLQSTSDNYYANYRKFQCLELQDKDKLNTKVQQLTDHWNSYGTFCGQADINAEKIRRETDVRRDSQ